MNKQQLKDQRLAALFLIGCLLFNYPLLSLFSVEGMIWGVPIFYIYIFTAWAALIGLMAIVIEYHN
jgi:hypothetical protein